MHGGWGLRPHGTVGSSLLVGALQPQSICHIPCRVHEELLSFGTPPHVGSRPAQRRGQKKILGTGVSSFFRGVPPKEGGVQKNSHERFSGPPKPEISSNLPHLLDLEGARRKFIKVTIDVSTDMGEFCVLGHKHPESIPAAVQRPPWPLIGRPKSGQKCHITPAFSGVPNKENKIKAQKSNKKPKIKNFHRVCHILRGSTKIACPGN